MDKITKGVWVINTVKHTSKVRTDTLELNNLAVTEKAGKCGMLLGKLITDKDEIITGEKLDVFARQSGISSDGIDSCIKTLNKFGQVDYKEDALGRISEVEIYCFSKDSALNTVSDIFEAYEPKSIERANLYTLEATFELPKTREEIISEIAGIEGISENDIKNIITLQDTFSLIKKDIVYNQDIYFNEYAFSDNAAKVKKAMSGLDSSIKNNITEIMNKITESQGYLSSNISDEYGSEIISMMEGVGLLDGIAVQSEFGDAIFYNTPQIIGIGNMSLASDVFHSAKLLLSSLRYGELKSISSRGAIHTKSKLINIINKLLRGEWVGPCTAIGQDYQLLEKIGVIQVKPINGMYQMKLRQIEVGQLVKQMLDHGRIIDEDINSYNIFSKMPASYMTPEERRQRILANKPKPVKDLQDKIIESLRTGGSF